MFQDFFKDSEWLSLPLITLVFFFAFFVVVLLRVSFGMRDKLRVDELAALPFADERQPAHLEEARHV